MPSSSELGLGNPTRGLIDAQMHPASRFPEEGLFHFRFHDPGQSDLGPVLVEVQKKHQSWIIGIKTFLVQKQDEKEDCSLWRSWLQQTEADFGDGSSLRNAQRSGAIQFPWQETQQVMAPVPVELRMWSAPCHLCLNRHPIFRGNFQAGELSELHADARVPCRPLEWRNKKFSGDSMETPPFCEFLEILYYF
eukprot:s1061_g2.t1